MNRAFAGSIPNRSRRCSKIRGSGLFTPTSPEMTIPSNHARKSNRSRATGNISADQLLRRDQSDACGTQIGQHLDRSRNLPGQHLGPSPMERLDELTPLRMLSDQNLDRLGEGPARVLVRVPLGRGHLGQERLHLVRVFEQLPVQVARVPVDEDTAEVEDHGSRVGRCGHPATLAGQRRIHTSAEPKKADTPGPGPYDVVLRDPFAGAGLRSLYQACVK